MAKGGKSSGKSNSIKSLPEPTDAQAASVEAIRRMQTSRKRAAPEFRLNTDGTITATFAGDKYMHSWIINADGTHQSDLSAAPQRVAPRSAPKSSASKTTPAKTSKTSKKQAQTPTKKFTAKEIDKMSRKQVEKHALDLYIKNSIKRGLSEAEAIARFTALVSSNTTTQLKKYLKRNQ